MSHIDEGGAGSTSQRRPLLPIDACVVINLYATTRTRDILGALRSQIVVVDQVVSESLYVMTRVRDELVRTQIDMTQEFESGLIMRVTLADAELATYIRHAAELDDGEAATFALADHRASAVASDDRAAINYLIRTESRLRVIRTTDIIREWMDATHADAVEVGVVLAEIRECGRFVPNETDPHGRWWRNLLREQAWPGSKP